MKKIYFFLLANITQLFADVASPFTFSDPVVVADPVTFSAQTLGLAANQNGYLIAASKDGSLLSFFHPMQ